MATFKPDEIRGLEEGGNGASLPFCHTCSDELLLQTLLEGKLLWCIDRWRSQGTWRGGTKEMRQSPLTGDAGGRMHAAFVLRTDTGSDRA